MSVNGSDDHYTTLVQNLDISRNNLAYMIVQYNILLSPDTILRLHYNHLRETFFTDTQWHNDIRSLNYMYFEGFCTIFTGGGGNSSVRGAILSWGIFWKTIHRGKFFQGVIFRTLDSSWKAQLLKVMRFIPFHSRNK